MNKMLYIKWNESNNLGIPIIDEQHRSIVATINSFHYFIEKGHGMDALKPTLTILDLYTNLHFSTEEEILTDAGYPGLNEHILLHKELLSKTIEIKAEATSFKEPEIALKFLKKWWLSHINIEDKHYADYIVNAV